MFKSFEEKSLPGVPASRFARRVATGAFVSAVAAMAVLPSTAGAFEFSVPEHSNPGVVVGKVTVEDRDRSGAHVASFPNPNGALKFSVPENSNPGIVVGKVTAELTEPEKVVMNSAVPQSVVESASMFIDGIQGHSERLQTKANHLWVDGVASYSHGRDDAYGADGLYKNGFKSLKAGFVAGYDVDLRDDLVAGAAVSWIRSKYNAKGFANVENKADTYGIALYSDWQATDKLKLGALAGWQRTKGRIRMDESPIKSPDVIPVQDFHVESKARTNAFVGSLRASYDVPVEALTVTPHVGLDFIHAKTRPMDVKQNGQVVGKVDFKSHTTWELPLGVRFSSVLDKDGWLIKPEADLTYTAVFGDRRMKFATIPNGEYGGPIYYRDVEFINSNRIGAAVGASFDNKHDKLFGVHYKVEHSKNGLDHQFKLEFVKRF